MICEKIGSAFRKITGRASRAEEKALQNSIQTAKPSTLERSPKYERISFEDDPNYDRPNTYRGPKDPWKRWG